MQFVLMLIYVLFNASGLVLMKLGSNKLSLNLTKESFNVLLSWKFIIGFLCYVCSFLLFSYLLTKAKLSYIYPLAAALCYILVVIFSYIFLKEQITLLQFIGIFFILCGVILMNISK